MLERKDSLNDMTDSEDEDDVHLFNESYLHSNTSNQSVDAEAVYIDALQNEVKQLQVINIHLYISNWSIYNSRCAKIVILDLAESYTKYHGLRCY